MAAQLAGRSSLVSKEEPAQSCIADLIQLAQVDVAHDLILAHPAVAQGVMMR